MGFAQSNMSIVDAQLVTIEIAAITDHGKSGLRLTDRGHIYDLLRAFASHKLDVAQQQLQHLRETNVEQPTSSKPDRYLLVREANYYSLWELDRSRLKTSNLDWQVESERQIDRSLQQASIWLLQELWLQWQDLLGAKQLQVFAEQLVALTPPLASSADLDRLLILDPLATTHLASWSKSDFMAFDRQLYHLTQKKMGQQFGTQLTIDIIQSMPDSLQATLAAVLDI
jgi:hypothetical protein